MLTNFCLACMAVRYALETHDLLIRFEVCCLYDIGDISIRYFGTC